MTNQTDSNSYNDEAKSLSALSSILGTLTPLTTSDRSRVLNTVLTFFGINQPSPASVANIPSVTSAYSTKAEDRNLTPKQFIMEKQPKTDVERIACLAYYLTHFREAPHFKTQDLTNLNTESAQPRLSNPAKAAANAVSYGYLALANKGNRQLSGPGELFVQNLPDREAAKSAMTNAKPRKAKTSSTKKKEI